MRICGQLTHFCRNAQPRICSLRHRHASTSSKSPPIPPNASCATSSSRPSDMAARASRFHKQAWGFILQCWQQRQLRCKVQHQEWAWLSAFVPKNLGKLIQTRRMCFCFRYHGALRGVAAGPRPGAEASYWSAGEGAQHAQSHYTARDLCTWMMWHTRSTGW